MKPRLLDLFCGAGGAAMGYHRAGFEVVGVDIKPQKHYPFEFHQDNALSVIGRNGHLFDAIHASPPCQAHCRLKSRWREKEHPDLVAKTRALLQDTGKPYVIENVHGAPLVTTAILCGTMFGLTSGEAHLWRHRLFETSFPLPLVPQCRHRKPVITVTGHCGGTRMRGGQRQYSAAERRVAMGIDWMTAEELSQAIPPAYTEWIGKQLLKALEAQ